MSDPIRSWDDPRWDEATDPYRLIRALSLAMALQVVGAAVLLVFLAWALLIGTALIGTFR